MHTSRSSLAAVVPAGGRARRLGGRDKPMLEVGGVPMLRSVVSAALAAGASPCVVVGPERAGLAGAGEVVFVREDPIGGGPVAAIARGLSAVGEAGVVAVLAGDLPFLSEGAINALLTALEDHDGAVFVDGDGRRQLLCGVWRTEALRGALAQLGGVDGASLRGLTAGLAVREVTWVAAGEPWFDCDTEDDLRRAGGRDG